MDGDILFHFDPRDMRGPSFHFAYDLMKGFQNYEETAKVELLNTIPPNGNFYDIGANIGMFSVYFARERPDINIFCFEPDSSAYGLLESTVKHSKRIEKNKISLFKTAIGSSKREEKLYKSSLNDGGHSFLNLYDERENRPREFEMVSIVSLDEFAPQHNLPLPHAIKVDVEGLELEVLKGSLGLIKKSRPVMMVESSNRDLAGDGPFFQTLLELEKLGLHARRVGETKKLSLNELRKVAERELDHGKIISNYFYHFSGPFH